MHVHFNSPQPAQVQALAYTQGTEIHVAPGQEQHLAHEAWHVVQQAQGRVKPTMQMKDGVAVNDDAGLEHEAEVMGAKAKEAGNQPRQLDKAPSGIENLSAMTISDGNVRLVQRKMLFPNLEANNGKYPDDAIRVDSETYKEVPENPFALDEPQTMDGKYNFVTVREQIIAAAHKDITPHHNDLARDRDVDYAGTVTYDNGEIEEWNNHSGHYQPGARWSNQAKFPTDKFQPVLDGSPWDYGVEMVVRRHGRLYRRKDENSDWKEVRDDSEEATPESSLIPETVKKDYECCILF